MINSLLAIKWDVSPYIFSIGGLQLRWYGVLFVSGFIFGYWLFAKFYKREGLPSKLLDPMLYMLLICALVGARLGHVFFYDWAYYKEHLGEILKVWHGGLASHGGAIAILFGIWWYAHKYGKKYNIDYVWICDRLALAIPFAGMAIRLGNLMNSEIYGYETSVPWGFIFLRDGQSVPHHPTQLYEALSYLLIGLLLLWIYYRVPAGKANLHEATRKNTVSAMDRSAQVSGETIKKGPYRGFLFGLFLVLLFGARFLIEFCKLPQEGYDAMAAAGGRLLNNGQLLSIPFVIAGMLFIFFSYRVKKPLLRTED